MKIMIKRAYVLFIILMCCFHISAQDYDNLKIKHIKIGLLSNTQSLKGADFSLISGSAVRMRGLQLSGISTLCVDGGGVQLSGLNNIAVKRFRGVQLTAGVNIAGEVDGALQLSPFANICQGNARGLQLSIANMADTLQGLQIGVFNVANDIVKGTQVGIVNIGTDTTALRLGLVNIYPYTRVQMLVYGGNVSKMNVAARFTNRRTYTMLGVGTHYLDLDKKFSGCFFYRVGMYKMLTHKWMASGDVGYFHIENFSNANADTPDRMYSLQARANLEYKLMKRLSLFASAGYSVTRYYDKAKLYERKPVIELGITLF